MDTTRLLDDEIIEKYLGHFRNYEAVELFFADEPRSFEQVMVAAALFSMWRRDPSEYLPGLNTAPGTLLVREVERIIGEKVWDE
jgi:hypothetical protein